VGVAIGGGGNDVRPIVGSLEGQLVATCMVGGGCEEESGHVWLPNKHRLY
jgi:hypothetical protein